MVCEESAKFSVEYCRLARSLWLLSMIMLFVMLPVTALWQQ